jgi:hypothetical protein
LANVADYQRDNGAPYAGQFSIRLHHRSFFRSMADSESKTVAMEYEQEKSDA